MLKAWGVVALFCHLVALTHQSDPVATLVESSKENTTQSPLITLIIGDIKDNKSVNITETKDDKAEKQLSVQFFANYLDNIGADQKIAAVSQIFFYNAFVLGVYFLVQVLILGCKDFIYKLRSPLLIYKEVEEYATVKPYEAPKLPKIHPEKGYGGEFKTPKHEDIKYHPYPKPKAHKPKKKEHIEKPKSSYSSY